MFACRNETSLIKRFARRISSARAAVFSEFAFLAPVLVLFLSAMIELAAFWDTQVMAHHTAWQISRIASVRGHESQKKGEEKVLNGLAFGQTYFNNVKDVTVPSFSGPFKTAVAPLGVESELKTYGDVTALYFMSTTGMGAFGQTAKKAQAGDLQDIFTRQGTMLAKWLVETLTQKIKDALKIKIDNPGIPLISDWLKQVNAWIGKLVDKVMSKIFNPIIKFIGGLVDKIIQKILGIDTSVYTASTWDRMASRLGAAAVRMKQPGYKLEYELPDPAKGPKAAGYRVWSDRYGRGRGQSFNFPQTALNTDPRDQGWIKKPNVWPPNGQKQSLVEVKLDWPFAGAWVFPIVSGLGEKGDAVAAHGRSLAYIQPAIATENLLSKGATAYITGPVATKASIGDLNIGNYVKLMDFSLKYRLRMECIYAGAWAWPHEYGWGTSGYLYQPLWDLYDRNKYRSDWRQTCRSLVIAAKKGPKPYTRSFPGDFKSSNWITYYTANVDRWFKAEFWAYREYFYWLNNTSLRPRYRGPVPCMGHHLVGICMLRQDMFFNHPSFLIKQKVHPDSGVHAQLMTAAMAYDKAEERMSAIEKAGPPPPFTNITVSKPAFAAEFKKAVRVDLNTLFQVYWPEEEAKRLVTTNKFMRTHAVKKDMCSLLRAQAHDFSLAIYEERASLSKIANGSSEEVADDLVSQAGIDMYNTDTEGTLKNIQKWWSELQRKINARYEAINQGVLKLEYHTLVYPNTVSAFCSRMFAIHFSNLNRELEAAYLELEAAKTPPTGDKIIAEVRRVLANRASAAEARRLFEIDYAVFKNAYEAFRQDIWKQCADELAWAGSVGVQTQHGRRPLTPDDIFPGGDNPDAPSNPPGGNPDVSGNDPFAFGDKWKLGEKGWESY